MRIWLGGVNLPPTKDYRLVASDAWAFLKYTSETSCEVTLHVFDSHGRPALQGVHTLMSGRSYRQKQDDVFVGSVALDEQQAAGTDVGANDLLLELHAYNSKGVLVFDIGPSGFRTSKEGFEIELLIPENAARDATRAVMDENKDALDRLSKR